MRAALLLAIVLPGCRYGMTAEKFVPARTPAGVSLRARVGRVEIKGELLEVRSAGLVVLGGRRAPGAARRAPEPTAGRYDGKVLFLAFDAISEASFSQLGNAASLRDGLPPFPRSRERLRLLSRFPQGMSPEILKRLLAASGQDDVVTVAR